MVAERGSTWGKWDFHVHTPYSKLANRYGFDPDNDTGEQFDIYVKTLFVKAIEAGFVAISITDYFSIDGYRRIKEDYLSNPAKLETLFPDEELRKRVLEILVFPNIELRLDTFVGKKDASVNYHVIFSDKLSADEIEENFLRELHLTDSADTKLSLTRSNIERIGSEYKKHNANNKDASGSDYLVGLRKAAVDYKEVAKVLNTTKIFRNNFFISIPVDEDLSHISWDGRDYQTRKNLYEHCQLIMSANPGTRKWALAEGHEAAQKSEFKSIKPCIWGSDAHSYDELFMPKHDRFCWIKAENTFEGLRQILCEPGERVRIQKENPEAKNDHHIIDYIQFDDQRFQSSPIFFNAGLTTIIGGKSTGKSQLLRHIAIYTDPKQVSLRNNGNRPAPANNVSQNINAKATVVWRDGFSGERSIIYIPQSWLNRAVDTVASDSQLNLLIQDILQQREDIGSADGMLRKKISSIIDGTRNSIRCFTDELNNSHNIENELRSFGRSGSFKATIEKLEIERSSMSSAEGITSEKLVEYTSLRETIALQQKTLEMLSEERKLLETMTDPFVFVPGATVISNDALVYYDPKNYKRYHQTIEQWIKRANNAIQKDWQRIKGSLLDCNDKELEDASTQLATLNEKCHPLEELVNRNDQLRELDNRIQLEKENLEKAEQLEHALAVCDENIMRYRQLILGSRQELRDAYEAYTKAIEALDLQESELSFSAVAEYKRKEIAEMIGSLFDKRTFSTFRDRYKYDILDDQSLDINDGLFQALWDATENKCLLTKGGATLQTVLDRLYADWFYLHFNITSGSDAIEHMSPGKKALVLLEVIVNLDKTNCPILIDQPEDDLDNRSIYNELVKYLRAKKAQRQIIIVTHNANVVIGADAEEVIIANQDGKESPNRDARFEYRCGAIENRQALYGPGGALLPGILNQKGIQEQICDILEGGKEAFELRERKYTSMEQSLI